VIDSSHLCSIEQRDVIIVVAPAERARPLARVPARGLMLLRNDVVAVLSRTLLSIEPIAVIRVQEADRPPGI
jgi:hypothetical protein